ncbi:hypothetical protein U0070_013119, partial [Myodes glareolus]
MDMISFQLTFIHIVLLFPGGNIWLWDIRDALNIENGFKCKTYFFLNRVMRSLSICITCLLGVIQAVTISTSTFFLAKFKYKLKKYMISVFLFIWSFNLSFTSYLIIYSGALTNMSETKQLRVTKFCSLFSMNYIIRALILTVTMSRDVLLVGLMLVTSAYMRHQWQHKYLYNLSHLRASPEKRATQTILLLVVCFVVMYWVDFIISFTAAQFWMYNPVILSTQNFIMNVYATITP